MGAILGQPWDGGYLSGDKVLDTDIFWETQPLPDSVTNTNNLKLGSAVIPYKNLGDLIIFQGTLRFNKGFKAGQQYLLFTAPEGFTINNIEGSAVGRINNTVWLGPGQTVGGMSTKDIPYQLSIMNNKLVVTMNDDTDSGGYGFWYAGNLDVATFRITVLKNI